jgi:hypothetical protein
MIASCPRAIYAGWHATGRDEGSSEGMIDTLEELLELTRDPASILEDASSVHGFSWSGGGFTAR